MQQSEGINDKNNNKRIKDGNFTFMTAWEMIVLQ